MTSTKTKDFKFNLDNKNLLKAFDEKSCLQKKLNLQTLILRVYNFKAIAAYNFFLPMNK